MSKFNYFVLGVALIATGVCIGTLQQMQGVAVWQLPWWINVVVNSCGVFFLLGALLEKDLGK